MHFYRIAGALIVAFSGFMGAYIMNSAISKGCAQADAIIELLRYVKVQIECFALPAGDIISKCDRSILAACGIDRDILPNNFEELFNDVDISNTEIARIVKNFASGFGKSYREEQLRECDYYISLLCEERKKLSEELPKRKKVNSALCISSALAAVIILL